MKALSHSQSRQPQRGSALITVLLFSFLLLTLVGSVMQWSLSERRLNARSGYWLEARNAAEAVAEYGCYQVAQAFNQNMAPTFGSGGNTQITFPTNVASAYFAGSHVDTSSLVLNVGAVRAVPWGTNGKNGGLYYCDPADPNNVNDPLVARYVNRRDVAVLTKATVRPMAGGGPPVTAYITETVSVRGAPLLAYAIFYSGNDLEVNPQPLMDIYGPVHVNGNLFIGSVGSNPINFHGPVSTSGNIFHAWKGTTSSAQEGSSLSTQNVNFATDTTGTVLASMKTVGGTWNDSTMGADSSTSGINNLVPLVTAARTAAFAQNASQTWHGNVQTVANGIQSYNPMGFTEIVAYDSSSNPILASDPRADLPATVFTAAQVTAYTAQYGADYTPGYGPHALIEPSLTPASSNTTIQSAMQAIETQKFANKAGLYIKVAVSMNGNGTGNTTSANITLYGDPNSAVGNVTKGPNGGTLLTTNTTTSFVNYIPYTVSSNNVTTGIYDQHQGVGVNIVQLDMGKLRTALSHMAVTSNMTGNTTTDIVLSGTTTKWGATSYNNGYDPNNPNSTGWNGGVYVEIDNGAYTGHTAVALTNGVVASGNSLVPNNTSGNPAPNSATGLTVATNGSVYILGSFNADGVVSSAAATNSALYPDDTTSTGNISASKETPVAIAGDAITILSGNYTGTSNGPMPVPSITFNATTGAVTGNITNGTSSSSSAYKSKSSANPNTTGAVEIAAALISGSNSTSPTSTGTQVYSGGVHNMPRFLENWGSGGTTVAIRGSLINMYFNKVDTAAWGSGYYSPPDRQWGFDQLFANGNYPPMIPNVLSYRRVNFDYVNAPDYATTLSGL
jgi:hypothetical protein